MLRSFDWIHSSMLNLWALSAGAKLKISYEPNQLVLITYFVNHWHENWHKLRIVKKTSFCHSCFYNESKFNYVLEFHRNIKMVFETVMKLIKCGLVFAGTITQGILTNCSYSRGLIKYLEEESKLHQEMLIIGNQLHLNAN